MIKKNKIIFDIIMNDKPLYMIIIKIVELDEDFDNLTLLEGEYIKKYDKTNLITNKAIQGGHNKLQVRKKNGKFNIEDYIKMKKKFINSKSLMEDYGISKNHSILIIKKLINSGLIIKLTVSNYIFKHSLDYFNNFEIAMIMDNSCYIGLYNVLERKIIKQAHTKTFALSNSRITKNNDILSLKNIEFIKIQIPLTFGIEYKNNIRYSDMERSLLDLIYLHIFAKMPITSELYLLGNIDNNKIIDYLKYYPVHVSNFYFNTLQNYVKQ